MKVRDAMNKAAFFCSPETTLRAAVELMKEVHCDFLPVLSSEGKVSGVITYRDICTALETRGLSAGEVTVADVISGDLYFCSPEDEVRLALETMWEAKVRRLPVTAQNGALLGVISRDDILSRVGT